MPRPVLLFSGQWTQVPLEELAQKLNDWGYQGIELCCWGDHFEVQRALSEDDYCQEKLDLLARYDLQSLVLSNHRVSQAVCDRIEPRHKKILPDYVWGDGDPAGVQERAHRRDARSPCRPPKKLGVNVIQRILDRLVDLERRDRLSRVQSSRSAGRPARFRHIASRRSSAQLHRDAGVRYALEVHPGQIAFDLFSAEMVLDAIDGREGFGFTFDPSHFHWQGIDPVEFVRRFGERIYHVHIKDIAMTLNGRTGILNAYQPYGDVRRGWEFRSPGRGGIDWGAIHPAHLSRVIHYEGPLSVEWSDAGMDRDHGAEEACKFAQAASISRKSPRTSCSVPGGIPARRSAL